MNHHILPAASVSDFSSLWNKTRSLWHLNRSFLYFREALVSMDLWGKPAVWDLG